MNVTLPNGKVIKNVPEGTTKQQIMDKAIASGLATADDFGVTPQQSQPQQPQEPPKQDIGFGEAFTAGVKRGVEQVGIGATQRVMEFVKGRHENAIDEFASKMQSGEIPATAENIARLDEMQQQAVNEQKALGLAGGFEESRREQMKPISEARPYSSFAGNVVGQMAAFPTPGTAATLPLQVARGVGEGAAMGYTQATTGEESPESNSRTGAAIGGAVPLALRPIAAAAGGAYRALTGEATGDAASALKYAKEKDIPLLTADVAPPRTFFGKGVQTVGEKVPIVGTGGRRADQQDARVESVKDIAKKYGEPDDKEIYDSLIRKSDVISKAAGKRYEEITNSMSGVDVPLTRTLAKIDEQIDALNRPGAISNDKLTGVLNKIKSDLSGGPQDLALLRSNRTRFREEVQGKDAVTNTTEKRIIDSVYNSITDDMDAAVRTSLGDVKADSLKQVDKVWAKEANELKKTKLKNIFEKGDVRPADASKMLFTGSPDEIKILYKSLDGEGRKKARAALIHKASDEGRASPEVFVNNMKRYQKQHNTFFRGKEGDELRGLLNYLDYTRQASKASTLTNTGQQMIPVAAVAGIGTDYVTTGGVGTALTAGTAALSSVYESPVVRDLMVKMSSVEKGSTAFEKLAAKLEAQLNMAATRTQGEQE